MNVIGYFRSTLGNGEAARHLVASLQAQGIPYAQISADFLVEKHAQLSEKDASTHKAIYDINIFCIDITYILLFIKKFGMDFLKNRYNILLFFWETDVVPEDRLKLFSYFDEVWVTTRYNQDCLTSVLPIPVSHVPLPLKLDYVVKAPNKVAFGLDDRYMFLFCFDFCSIFQRKNPMAVVEAFREAFVDRNDVQLVIKSHNGHHHRRVLEGSLTDIKGDKRITWMDTSMDQQRRYDLMNACDCYVSLHRSEGFGLTMAEAMLLEKPVIATAYSGNLDFMTHDNSFLCGYELIHVGQGHYPYPPEGVWADVDVAQAAAWMTYVVNNRVEARRVAAKGHFDVEHNHSFSAVGRAIEARLGQIDLETKKSVLSYPQYFKDLASYYVRGIGRRLARIF